MEKEEYVPSAKIIDKYANVLVDFALGGGKGMKEGDTVLVAGGEASRPLYIALCKAIWKRGGHVIGDYDLDTYSDNDNLPKFFYENASDEQISHFKRDYAKGLAKEIDHQIGIVAETNKQALAGVDPAKIMKRGLAHKPLQDWLNEKENQGKFSWTVALYGTEAMAREVGLSLQEYWQQIISACFLDEEDPIAKWREVTAEIGVICEKLNKLPIEWVHIKGPDIDLRLKIGADRKWRSGSGCNIPSFEIFTSPDWRGAVGWAKFNQPLYRYGNLIEGVELKLEDGRVVEAKARKNQKVLHEMIVTEGADRVGEFSLTDSRHSRITKFMAETLFDENVGGEQGNTHIALGLAYKDCYRGDVSKVTDKQWQDMGFNDSSVHTDIVSTTKRTVTATLANGKEKVIYKNGQFTL